MSPLGGPGAQPPSPPPAPGGNRALPERMKANKALAGKECPGCGSAIGIGDEVWNCPACRTPQHEACHAREKGCCSADCDAGEAPPDAAGAETKACPYCGEQVLKSAKKCKHCKEILSASLRAARDRKAKGDVNEGRSALIYAIVGIFICQPILGTYGIVKGRAALKRGVQTGMATAAVAIGCLDLLLFVAFLILRVTEKR